MRFTIVIYLSALGCSYAGVKTQQALESPLNGKACIEEAIKETDGVEYGRSFRESRLKRAYPEGSVRETLHTVIYDIEGMQRPKDRTAYVVVTEEYSGSKLLRVQYRNEFRERASKVSEDDRKIARAALAKVNEAVRSRCNVETLNLEVTEFQ